jgi:hypothetical protein
MHSWTWWMGWGCGDDSLVSVFAGLARVARVRLATAGDAGRVSGTSHLGE